MIKGRLQEDPENMMTNSNEDGVDKVLVNRGSYAYIMESGSIDYQVGKEISRIFSKIFLFFKVARNCRLTQVGKMFWPRSYGLALAPGDGGGVDGGGVCGAWCVVVVELSHSHCQPQHKNSQGPPTERS